MKLTFLLEEGSLLPLVNRLLKGIASVVVRAGKGCCVVGKVAFCCHKPGAKARVRYCGLGGLLFKYVVDVGHHGPPALVKPRTGSFREYEAARYLGILFFFKANYYCNTPEVVC